MKLFIYILFLVSFWQYTFSQTSFTASANRNSVALNQNLQVSFSLKNGKAKSFTPPPFKNFTLISGPHKSQSTQMVNFDVTTSITWTYVLNPKKEGDLTIESATVDAEGKKIKSNKLTVAVGPAAAGNSAQNNNSGSQGISKDDIKQNVFIKQIVDKRNVYVGEQVTVTYKLYNRLTLVNITPKKNPSYEGFWTQDIEVDKASQRSYETIGNQRYEVITIKKEAIFPQKAGELKLSPFELDAVARVQTKGRPRSMFDEMFGSYRVRDIPVELESNSSALNVKGLPPGEPESFNGAVGVYRLETNIESSEAQTDNPITINIKISGRGNIRMLNQPKFRLPANFDMFDPKVKEYVSKKSNTVNGYKSFDFLVIPRAPGEYKLPPISFSYFDVEKQKYIEESTEEYIIDVEGESSLEGAVSGGLNKEEVEMLGKDIRYIKQDLDLSTQDQSIYGSGIFYGLCASPFLLFTGLLFFRKRQKELESDLVSIRSRKAGKNARKKLNLAKKELEKGNSKEFFDTIEKAVWTYFSDKLNIDNSQITREGLLERLSEKKVDKSVSEMLNKVLDTCEMYLYAPSSVTGQESETLNSASELISKLEKEL